MEKTTRRIFCSTAVLAVPALPLLAKENSVGSDSFSNSSDPIFDALTEEFNRVTADGAQNGFKAEHFRRYAEFMRIFNAHMESKGYNKEFNKKLDEDDFYKLDPVRTAKSVAEFWRKHNVEMREDELTEQLAIDWKSYMEFKKSIRKNGGIQTLYLKVAEAFERKAKEYETSSLRGSPVFHQGKVLFPVQNGQPHLLNAQFGWLLDMIVGFDMDCFCKALIATAALCGIICVFGCPALCIPAALLLALEKIMEGMYLCNPDKC
jgi:hypothetical protein